MRNGLFVVEARFARLGVLELAADTVERSVFEQPGSGLPETERYSALDTLPAQIEHPFERAGTCFEARLASGDQLFEPWAGPRRKVDRAEQRLTDDYFMSDRCIPIDRQPVVGPLLVFDRAADRDVRVSRSPVRR